MDHHGLLCRSEHGLQTMGRVRAIPEDITLLPLVDRLLSDAVALGQGTGWLMTGGDLGAHCGRGAGVLVQGYQHGVTPRVV